MTPRPIARTILPITTGEHPMPQIALDQIEELKDHIYAVQQLLLALCVASARIDRVEVENAFAIARGQGASLAQRGRGRVALRIAALIEDVEQCLD
jgi:hypothetical protein